MAKKYLDLFLSANCCLNESEHLLAVVTCLRVAAKVVSTLNQFNEISDFSNMFTTSFCSELCTGQYEPHKFSECEAALI